MHTVHDPVAQSSSCGARHDSLLGLSEGVGGFDKHGISMGNLWQGSSRWGPKQMKMIGTNIHSSRASRAVNQMSPYCLYLCIGADVEIFSFRAHHRSEDFSLQGIGSGRALPNIHACHF